MNATPIRIGRIGTVNQETGMVSIVYEDRGDASTDEIPVLMPGGIWKAPPIGAMVEVLTLSNGSSMGIVNGMFTGAATKPVPGFPWSILFGQDPGQYMAFRDGTLVINCNVEIHGTTKSTGNVIAPNIGGD